MTSPRKCLECGIRVTPPRFWCDACSDRPHAGLAEATAELCERATLAAAVDHNGDERPF